MDKLPVSISPTKLKDFKLCPQKFYFNSILRKPTTPTVNILIGELVHLVLEVLFEHSPSERIFEIAQQYVEPAWDMLINPFKNPQDVASLEEDRLRLMKNSYALGEDKTGYDYYLATKKSEQYQELAKTLDMKAVLDDVTALVKNYFNIEHPDRFTPVAREKQLRSTVDGVPLIGYLDRLDKITAKSGDVRWYVSDYKTGKTPLPAYVMDNFFAMIVYSILLKETEDIDVYRIRLVYVKDTPKKAVIQLDVTESILNDTRQEVVNLWERINEASDTGNWAPTPNKLCNWCDFKEICPAFGGTY